jgi:hydroxypyruvate isomerase
MNERALANRLRIAIIDKISEVDLPGFLFEQIDQSLLELNYFKLSNLHTNLDTYLTYLEEIQTAYINFIKTHNPLQTQALPKSKYEPFMTDSLYSQAYECNFS